MDFSEVTSLFKGDLAKVEDEIRKNYRSEISLIPDISGYLMNGGGKRFRPLLVLLSSKLCGGDLGPRTIKHACAIEYIHAATLLHDDVVDETTVRRRRETVNSKWGSDASILVGDFLISKAIILVAYDSDQRIFQSVAESAKILVEGGILEYTNARKLTITEKEYLDIIYRKTASIISLSCQIGALLAGVERETEKAMIAFGNDLGMAFQLVDDALDYDGTEEILGKPVGTDLKEGHVTLPLLHLYKKGNSAIKKEIEDIVQNKNIGQKALDSILEKMREFKSIDYTLDKARDYVEKAKSGLKNTEFKSPEYLDALYAVADFIVDRHIATKPS